MYGVDPSLELQRIARKRKTGGPFGIEFLTQSAKAVLPLANASIDTAVMTWTLCSIANPALALYEINRVLKPDGRLIFLEHGLAPDPRVVVWQDRLTPVWKRIGGGCRLNRRIDEPITNAGFQLPELKAAYLPGPGPMTYTYQGVATQT